MVNIEEALEIILEESKSIGYKETDIVSACGYVLSEDIYANDTLPPFNKSAMDGYALNSEDTQKQKTFEIKGIIKAGETKEYTLAEGEALKIMTGAPLPLGADCVVEIEKVSSDLSKLTIESSIDKGRNIIFKGNELESGDLILEKGTIIRPVEVGLLASLGYSKIKIYKVPVVACLTTGDELIEIDSAISHGKIRNSNKYILHSLVKDAKAIPLVFNNTPDDKEILKANILEAFNKADIVVSTGGASVGDFDFVLEVLNEIGADVKFTKVSIKPGKPITFATFNNKLYFSLPGNPMSAITSFDQFVKPSIEKILGYESYSYNNLIKVKIGDGFKLKKGRVKYVYVDIVKNENEYIAYNGGVQCSNHLLTLSKSNGIVIIPESVEQVEKGDIFNGRFIF